MGSVRFLNNFAEAIGRIPLEEADHSIELSGGCAPRFATTAEHSTTSFDLPRVAGFWSFLNGF
jgi:hypothetical protein